MKNQNINFLVYGSNEFLIQRKHLIRLAKDSGFLTIVMNTSLKIYEE